MTDVAQQEFTSFASGTVGGGGVAPSTVAVTWLAHTVGHVEAVTAFDTAEDVTTCAVVWAVWSVLKSEI